MRFFIFAISLLLCASFAATARETFSTWAPQAYDTSLGSAPPSSSSASSIPHSSGNPSNDKLLGMPENGQAAMLSKATRYGCIGRDPYYMGTETRGVNKGVSFWSISCKGGGEFLIAIAPDAIGSTKVITCNMLRREPWKCYEKIKDAR